MHVLVTGGCGFIGSAWVRHVRRARPGWTQVVLDKLTYAGALDNLAELTADPSVVFVRGDVTDRPLVERVLREHRIEAVVHLAAESHVDRSIADPSVFTVTNVLGTQAVLDASRAAGVRRVVAVSTDEVYGSLGPTGRFDESSPLQPSSPYAASKAAADLLALSYVRTYGQDLVVTRCSNNYGPRQFPEKLIPLAIARALADEPVPLYGDGANVRDWIHVEDHCEALLQVLERGAAGETYNIGGGEERTNRELLETLLRLLGKPASLLQRVADRPGHDRRYALDAGKLQRALGWRPRRRLEDGLSETVRWYVENRSWWARRAAPRAAAEGTARR